MKRKEVRSKQLPRINQQHRQAIKFVIWYLPKDLDSHCHDALQILEEAANLAEGFDKLVWKDIIDTAKKISELRQNAEYLNSGDLNKIDQENFANKKATLHSELFSKLQRIYLSKNLRL